MTSVTLHPAVLITLVHVADHRLRYNENLLVPREGLIYEPFAAGISALAAVAFLPFGRDFLFAFAVRIQPPRSSRTSPRIPSIPL